MSAPLTRDDVLDLQRMLVFYCYGPLKLDGRYGPKTEAAEARFRAGACVWTEADARTVENLRTMHPRFAPLADQFLETVRDGGIEATARILSGRRSWPAQSALYAQGRTAPGPVVTNARPGTSFHNYGLAFDVGLFYSDGRYMAGRLASERLLYARIAQIRGARLHWGGLFTNSDAPHYQLAGYRISDLRSMWMDGEALVIGG